MVDFIQVGEREPSPDDLKVLELGLKQPLTTLQMRAPQILGTHFGFTHRKHILALDKGMGKTIVYLTSRLRSEPEKVIIVCPTNAMPAQRREILRHFPFYADKWLYVRGSKDQRYKLWRREGNRIFICTMATLQTDMGFRLKARGEEATSIAIVPPWVMSATHLDVLIQDEFQRSIRNRSSSWKVLKKLSPQEMTLSSGSPTSKSPADLWPALNLCDPKLWSSYWKYVSTFCEQEEGYNNTKQIVGPKLSAVPQWRNAIAPTVFHRKKDPRDFPPKARFVFDIELPVWQMKLYEDLKHALFHTYQAEGSPRILVSQNTLDGLYRARLGLICPRALDSTLGVGAGIEAIVDDADELSHYVISTPFKSPLPHLRAYLEAKGRRVYTLAGGLGITPEEQDRIIRDFEANGGVVLQTILYATSYEFLEPEHQYFLGYDYDNENNKQAEDRMSRLSSTKPSTNWYVRALGTYDEEMLEAMVIRGQNLREMWDKGKYWDIPSPH